MPWLELRICRTRQPRRCVFYVGYGSLYERVQWQDDRFAPGQDPLETQRGFFLKLSYLWRL